MDLLIGLAVLVTLLVLAGLIFRAIGSAREVFWGLCVMSELKTPRLQTPARRGEEGFGLG